MRRLQHLGAALRLLRHERGLTQRDLAHRTGVDPSQLSRYEGETIDPSLRTLALLLEAMHATFGDLEEAQERMAALAAGGREPSARPGGGFAGRPLRARSGEVIRSGRRGYLVVEITRDLEAGEDMELFHQAVAVVDRFLDEQAAARETTEGNPEETAPEENPAKDDTPRSLEPLSFKER